LGKELQKAGYSHADCTAILSKGGSMKQKQQQEQDPMLGYKKEYNALLEREKKAEAYLNDNNIPIDERNQWGARYNEICERLGWLLQQIGRYTPDEILYGFEMPVQDGLFAGIKSEEVIYD
jgi:hypothetical protein